jgi:hypothetical protein
MTDDERFEGAEGRGEELARVLLEERRRGGGVS